MNRAIIGVQQGSTLRPERARDFVSPDGLAAAREIAGLMSRAVLQRQVQMASQKENAIMVDSSSDDVQEVFDHDESEDEENFQFNKAAHRKLYI